MDAAAKDFLRRLLETPSPSGYERPVQDVVREYARPFTDSIRTDVHGNVILAHQPNAAMRVMLAGHCDQIGLLVSQIDENGFLYTQTIGGWDPQQLIGQRMTIWGAAGPIPAVISRKPIHLLKEEERKQVAKLEELWLDIGARDKAEVAALVKIGDPVTLELGMREMRNGLANSPAMDNKTGVWIVVEALRRAVKLGVNVGLFAVSTVQEEIGLRGAQTSTFGIDPHVGIAVDVTHATDCPGIDRKQLGDIGLGKGPVIFRGPNINPKVHERLVAICTQREWAYQPAAVGRATPNDANTIQVSRAGVATGLVSTPNRYMHSAVEMVSLDDLDRSADLLAAFCADLTGSDDFTP